MAFDFFKKNNYADTIFVNGHIYTQNAEFPWATAVACRDGKIMAVGESEAMEQFSSEDTVEIDLDGKYMFPGFINAYDTGILNAFQDLYLAVDPIWDLDTVMETVEENEDSDESALFGYGYDDSLLDDYETLEDRIKLLDEACEDKPVALLSVDGRKCWINRKAYEKTLEAAETIGAAYVDIDFILDAIDAVDIDDIASAAAEKMEQFTDKGYTSVLELCVPDYFDKMYQYNIIEMLNRDEEPKMRTFRTVYQNRPGNVDYTISKLEHGRDYCLELDNLVNCNMLKIELSDDEDLAYFTESQLEELCEKTAEKGFNIHIDALDKNSLKLAEDTLFKLRDKGYKKNTFVIAAEGTEDKVDSEMIYVKPTSMLDGAIYGNSRNVGEAIDNLTLKASEVIGMEDKLGSIEVGKLADFTVFNENPFEKDLRYFSRMHSEMVVVGGNVVYDAEDEYNNELCDMIFGLQV